MRKAVAHIIDRNQIVNVAYEGTTVASDTMFAEYGAMAPFIDAREGGRLRPARERAMWLPARP